MGFISNQWLNRGRDVRNRGYRPVEVGIVAQNPSDSWSRTRGIGVEFRATRANSEYQTIHLTRAEAEQVAESIMRTCSEEIRRRIASILLRGMSDTEFLKLLLFDLKHRVKN